ncbi:MAG: hypothetical protein ACRBN8_33275 [Nannocystales bacterium]
MPLASRMLLALFGSVLACSLPIEEKSACDDGFDCLDGRACVQGQCMDSACELACDALCAARNSCTSSPPCTASCAPELSDDLGLSPVQCSLQYDLLEGGSCEAESCFDGCLETCNLGLACALIDDAATCTVQCQREPTCAGLASACNELDAAGLSCWARGELRGC